MKLPDSLEFVCKRLLPVLALAALTSCASMQSLVQEASGRPRPPLAYFAWLEAADAESLEQERLRLTRESGNRNQEINLIQRALLYSVPVSAGRDSMASAMELLTVALQDDSEEAVTSPLQEDYRAFAKIWLALLENKRDYQSAQENQLSDQDRIRELSVKVDRLERQIEALTTIEQRLIEREQEQAQQ